MKNRFNLFAIALLFGAASCSTCYECTNSIELTDGNGTVVDTTENIEEFCTADAAEVEQRESEGAVCRVN